MTAAWKIIGIAHWGLFIGERMAADIYQSQRHVGEFIIAGTQFWSRFPTLAEAQAVAEDAVFARIREEVHALEALENDGKPFP